MTCFLVVVAVLLRFLADLISTEAARIFVYSAQFGYFAQISDAVDSTQRGKSYEKALLRLILTESRQMGITEEILVTFYPGNVFSRCVAEANGDQLCRETEECGYYCFA